MAHRDSAGHQGIVDAGGVQWMTSGPDRTQISIGQLALIAQGRPIEAANTSDAPLDVLLLGGAPAEGPLVFHGPFVMNSVEQIRHAERAYMTGRMVLLNQD